MKKAIAFHEFAYCRCEKIIFLYSIPYKMNAEASCHLLPLRKNRAYFFLFDYASLQTRHGPTFCKITYIKNLLNITIKPKTQYY